MKRNKENFDLVYQILREDAGTRENDMYLYIEYVNRKSNKKITEDLLKNPEEYGIAPYKTIERLRRKLQEIDRVKGDYAIQSTKQIQEIRKKLEKEYKKKFGHNIITRIIALVLILAMLIPTVIGILPYLIH